MADFQFPNFNVPFPYQNFPQQLQASMQGPQLTNGGQYGRWNGVNNNAFGLFPDQWPSLFGSPVPQPMQFQPPWMGQSSAPGAPQAPGGVAAVSGSNGLQGAIGNGGMGALNALFGNGSGGAFGGGLPQIPPGGGMQGGQPIMQTGQPPTTPGMQMPPMNPGQSLFRTALNNVAPGGGGNVPAPTAQAPATPASGNFTDWLGGNGTPPASAMGMSKVAQVPGSAPAGLLGPSIPNVTGNNAQFSTNMMPTGGNEFSREMQAAMNDPNNAFGRVMMQMYGSQPQTMTPAQFNQVARTNPGQAYTMLAQGGQPYQNAIMQQNGWNQQQMNDFINNAFYNQGGATARFGG